jgi:hypothetical protein
MVVLIGIKWAKFNWCILQSIKLKAQMIANAILLETVPDFIKSE